MRKQVRTRTAVAAAMQTVFCAPRVRARVRIGPSRRKMAANHHAMPNAQQEAEKNDATKRSGEVTISGSRSRRSSKKR